MALIKSGILGNLTGSVRNVTGRIRNGKNYLSGKPDHYTAPQDELSVARRKKFKLSVMFAKSVNELNDLKLLWEANAGNGLNAFNLITQVNYKLMENNLLSPANVIVPVNGFSITALSAELNSLTLEATINEIGNGEFFDLTDEKSIKLYSVIFLSSPNIQGIDDYAFVSIESSKQPFVYDMQIAFNAPVGPYQSSLFAKYDDKHFYYAVVTLDEKDLPVHHSITLFQ